MTDTSTQERARAILRTFCGNSYLSESEIELHAPQLVAALTEAERRGEERMRERFARDIRRLKMKAQVADRFGTLTVLETIERALSLDGGDQ